MSTEAQRLISVSLTKIAHSRAQRGGVSLHKNLLVATVLQRARYIFMEEAYHMVHIHSMQPRQQKQHDEYDEESLVALATEETDQAESNDPEPPPCDRCTDSEEDKENHLPPPYSPTYIDLDKDETVLRERNNVTPACTPAKTTACLKRRRVDEWETEEAVTSILPKRVKPCCDEDRAEDEKVEGEASMEIDRITSLVSIFSFGGLGAGDVGKLTRSVSTPDLCSAQAKEGVVDSLQQRSFLAMTV